MNSQDLKRIIGGLGSPRILIVGDLILDRYVSGDVGRISPEAPIPVLRARHTQERLGGAGNVAANLRAMEAEVEVLGVVGRDERGDLLLSLLEGIGVETGGTLTVPGRPTTQKTRMMSGVQQMLRVDWEEVQALEDEAPELLRGLEQRLSLADAVILSDYGKGVLTDRVLRAVIDSARRSGVPVLVDPKGTDFSRYNGATLVTPNRTEAELAIGHPIAQLSDLPAAARELMDAAELSAAVITLGPDGVFFQEREDGGGLRSDRVPTMARAVFDVTGAGDTVIAQLGLALGAGLELEAAVRLANLAAGIVVGRRGAASVTRDELLASLGETRNRSGVLTPEELPEVLAEWRAQGKRIVFTNGCFDILHVGHVAYLSDARSRGDVLIVGVNDDESVCRIKGPQRPINPLADRMTVLAALEVVDAVVPFGDDTPKELVERVTPDVLVKGQDWEDKGVVGREWVEKHGGEVYLAPLVPDRSTTAIAERLRGEPSS